jgi:hypothetical protein
VLDHVDVSWVRFGVARCATLMAAILTIVFVVLDLAARIVTTFVAPGGRLPSVPNDLTHRCRPSLAWTSPRAADGASRTSFALAGGWPQCC